MSAHNAESLREAVGLARSGNEAKALELLRGAEPPVSGAEAALYHYTLGTLLLKSGKAGEALAHLHHARILGATGPEVGAALDSAHLAVEQRLGAGQTQQASFWYERLADSPYFLPMEGLCAVIALSVTARLWRSPPRRAARIGSLLVCVLLWTLAAGMAFTHRWTITHPSARVAETSPVRSGPGEDFVLLGEVLSGVEIRVESSSSTAPGWLKVRVSDALTGWVERDRVLLLTGSANAGPNEMKEPTP
jgi:hypothetical protein